MMVLCATWCGVTLNHKFLGLQILQGKQVIFLERRSYKSFCIWIDWRISQELINFACKAISYYSNRNCLLFGLPQSTCTDFKILPLWWRWTNIVSCPSTYLLKAPKILRKGLVVTNYSPRPKSKNILCDTMSFEQFISMKIPKTLVKHLNIFDNMD